MNQAKPDEAELFAAAPQVLSQMQVASGGEGLPGPRSIAPFPASTSRRQAREPLGRTLVLSGSIGFARREHQLANTGTEQSGQSTQQPQSAKHALDRLA